MKLYSPNLYIKDFSVKPNLDIKTITYFTGNPDHPEETIDFDKLNAAAGANDNEKVILLQNQLNAEKAKVNQLNSEITEKNAKIESLENDISIKQTEISDLKSDIDAEKANAATLNATIASKNSELATLNGELHDALVDKEQLVQEKNVLVAEVDAKQATIDSLDATLNDNQTVIDNLNAEIEVKDAEIATKDAEITSKDEEIATLNTAITSKEAEISALETEKAELDASIASKEADLEAKTNELETANNTIAELEAQIAQLEADKAELEEKNAELQEIINAMPGAGDIDPAFPEAISQNFTVIYGEDAEFQIARKTFSTSTADYNSDDPKKAITSYCYVYYKNLSDKTVSIHGLSASDTTNTNGTYKFGGFASGLGKVEPGQTLVFNFATNKTANYGYCTYINIYDDPPTKTILKSYKIDLDYLMRIKGRTVWPQ